MKVQTGNVEYAIVDIETTGGSARGSKITEIAIRIHDGKEVIERWESLVRRDSRFRSIRRNGH